MYLFTTNSQQTHLMFAAQYAKADLLILLNMRTIKLLTRVLRSQGAIVFK